MKKLTLVCTLLLWMSGSLFADDVPKTGTLIVVYQTDSQANRLDRVRFLMKREGEKTVFHPKGDTFVEDMQGTARRVVIENLHPGNYTLSFLVPNSDGYFEEVPHRDIFISAGEIVKLNQEISPTMALGTFEDFCPATCTAEDVKTGKLVVSYEFENDAALSEQVRFKLVAEGGESTQYPREEKDTVISYKTGQMVMLQDVTIGDYEIVFFLENEPLKIIAEQSFRLEENYTKSIHQLLEKENLSFQELVEFEEDPKLTVNTNIPTAVYHLASDDGEIALEGKGREYQFKDLKPGFYHLSFDSTDSFFVPPEDCQIEIFENQDNEIEAIFESLGKLKVLTNIQKTEVTLTNMNTQSPPLVDEICYGMGVLFLPEGHYQLTFKSLDENYVSPPTTEIQISALQTEEVNVYFENYSRETSLKSD